MRLRLLDAIERIGDRLPDPVSIFAWLIGALVVLSAIAAAAGYAAVNPVTGELLQARSLVDPHNLRTLLVEMPRTLTGFAPLGYVLLVMLGAGLAERVGLLGAAVRGLMRRTPKGLITPAVIVLGLLSNQAADTGFIVLLPLAGAAFAAVGRNPLAGIAAAFAGVAASFAGDPLPGQFDALILGLSEPAARLIDPSWRANMVGNWYFMLATTAVFVPLGWLVTDRIVEPRLGPWSVPEGAPPADAPLTAAEVRGLRWAGVAALVVAGLWAAMALVPGGPLSDPAAPPGERLTPFFRSLIAGFFMLFLSSGIAFGIVTGQIRRDRDVVRLCTESMAAMSPYIVLAFVAAHFIVMITWSNLGAICAINGAQALKATGLPLPLLLVGVVLMTVVFDLFIGSASAKWAALAPVLVPMFMLLGLSPEMTTAAYRMGDAVINMSTPLMVYFPLALGFCRRWRPDIGVGGLMACTLPYSAAFLPAGIALVAAWSVFGWSPGPGESVHYTPPAPAAAAPAAPAR